jgi:hypothetical protein
LGALIIPVKGYLGPAHTYLFIRILREAYFARTSTPSRTRCTSHCVQSLLGDTCCSWGGQELGSSYIYVSPKDSQATTQATLTATVRYRECDVVGRPVTQLPQDLHFEESHGRVGSISKVGWQEIQAGFASKAFSRLAACQTSTSRSRSRPRASDWTSSG